MYSNTESIYSFKFQKLNTKYQQDKANHKTLQQIVLREKDKSGKLVAIDALLWLRRWETRQHFL